MFVRHGRAAIASMSPERFFSIKRLNSNLVITANPIKGTIGRDLNSQERDELLKSNLKNSQKDQAELNMIVDLMRNDLSEVSVPLSVHVDCPRRLVTHHHVHHLEASVSAQLRPSLTFGDLFSALCPAGSITGAPKLEVMKHIRRYEGCDRGYFMGHGFICYDDGSMDSNILIRTLVSQDDAATWFYAAGSGLVVKSDPRQELLEIMQKCRPLTD